MKKSVANVVFIGASILLGGCASLNPFETNFIDKTHLLSEDNFETAQLKYNGAIIDTSFQLQWPLTKEKMSEIPQNLKEHNIQHIIATYQYDESVDSQIGQMMTSASGGREFEDLFFFNKEEGITSIDEDNFFQYNFFKKLEKLFENKLIFGVGELNIDNSEFAFKIKERKVPLNSEVMNKILLMTEKYFGFVVINMTANEENFQALLELSAKFPKTQFILSNALMGDADKARHYLSILFNNRYNVFSSISAANGGIIRKKQKGDKMAVGKIFDQRGLDKQWAHFIHRYQDKFILASNIDANRWEHFNSIWNDIRQHLLMNLNKEARDKIAFKNAQRIFYYKPILLK